MLRRILILACAIAALCGPASAQGAVSDVAVKAAFIPRFARYVTWPVTAPANGSGPLSICVIGEDPFGNALDQAAASQSVDGRPLVVKRVLPPAAASSGCAMAFVDGAHRADTLALLAHQPILTITDSRAGPERGIIHFAVVGGRVRFFIDNAQAQARGLTISSRLLALAIGVNQK